MKAQCPLCDGVIENNTNATYERYISFWQCMNHHQVTIYNNISELSYKATIFVSNKYRSALCNIIYENNEEFKIIFYNPLQEVKCKTFNDVKKLLVLSDI